MLARHVIDEDLNFLGLEDVQNSKIFTSGNREGSGHCPKDVRSLPEGFYAMQAFQTQMCHAISQHFCNMNLFEKARHIACTM